MSATPDPSLASYVDDLRRMLITELELPDRKPEDLDPLAPLFSGAGENSLGLDSIDALQIAMGIEECFGVRIPEGEASHEVFRSIQSLAAYIAAQKALPSSAHSG
jgi:acyl carrier protein